MTSPHERWGPDQGSERLCLIANRFEPLATQHKHQQILKPHRSLPASGLLLTPEVRVAHQQHSRHSVLETYSRLFETQRPLQEQPRGGNPSDLAGGDTL